MPELWSLADMRCYLILLGILVVSLANLFASDSSQATLSLGKADIFDFRLSLPPKTTSSESNRLARSFFHGFVNPNGAFGGNVTLEEKRSFRAGQQYRLTRTNSVASVMQGFGFTCFSGRGEWLRDPEWSFFKPAGSSNGFRLHPPEHWSFTAAAQLNIASASNRIYWVSGYMSPRNFPVMGFCLYATEIRNEGGGTQ